MKNLRSSQMYPNRKLLNPLAQRHALHVLTMDTNIYKMKPLSKPFAAGAIAAVSTELICL
jgi:hypothetical protein